MKKLLIIALGLAFAPSAFAANNELNTSEQKASYTLGADLAKNFTEQGLKIDIQAFTLGLEDAIKNRPLKLTEEEMMSAIGDVKKEMLEKQQADRKLIGDANIKEGQAFLAKNAKKAGVSTLPSGVQYKVITKGKGASPSAEDTLIAHYKGTLIDGTEFDSSYKRGTPLKFQMGDVIKGWGEVMKLMNPGSKWEVYIPANMAYGAKGAGQAIGPHETLIFTIELITFNSDTK
ncbi:MAG: FKBP-type peptidyl-prolyl cis-trans isomerase [Pseudomonadota bacterium]